jgi:glycosyltransferase involved in cell wall biosynthesis
MCKNKLKEKSMPNVTAVIPCYKNPTYLDLCLRSAVEGRVDKYNKILVVLDGFTEMFTDIVAKYKSEVEFYGFDENMGMQAALNHGVQMAPTEYIFILNDDNVFGKAWDTKLAKHLKYRLVVTANQVEPDQSMFNFVTRNFGRTVETFHYDAWIQFEESWSSHKNSKIITADGCIFPFAMSKREYLAAGGFDTYYNSPNVCDWDFFLKLQLNGFYFCRIHDVNLYHFGSVITKKGTEASTFSIRQQMASEQFYQKWGFYPINIPGYNIKFPLKTTTPDDTNMLYSVDPINGVAFPNPFVLKAAYKPTEEILGFITT